MAQEQDPKPGDPGWTHPHVKGETDPSKIKAEIDKVERDEASRRDQIIKDRHSR